MDAMLRALADGTRRDILSLVWRKERTAGEISAKFKITRPAVSQHLGVLLASQLISVRRDGTRRLYLANRRSVTQLRAALEALWDERLTLLKDAAQTAERKRKR
jgi:DNA-binding transcriptional ArsR family regulator